MLEQGRVFEDEGEAIGCLTVDQYHVLPDIKCEPFRLTTPLPPFLRPRFHPHALFQYNVRTEENWGYT